MKVSAQLRWTISQFEVEPRLVTLLEAIASHGNLQQAARTAGMSYRHAWGILESSATQIGEPLVLRHQGRGTVLAPFGYKLLEGMVEINGSAAATLRQGEARMARILSSSGARATQPVKTTLYASHDLALAQLRDNLASHDGCALELQFHGSLDCLAALRRNQCELAGFHLPELSGARTLAAQFIPFLSSKGWRATRLLDRTQGLMVSAGNPKNLLRLPDMAGPKIRFVNRQPGSGTRLCLDFLLSQQGVQPSAIHGYTHEEFTHAAVAATVASGMADVAFGIEAAAREHGLDFVPIVNEHYYLAARSSVLQRPGVAALLGYIDTSEFRRLVDSLAGYRSVAKLQWVNAMAIL